MLEKLMQMSKKAKPMSEDEKKAKLNVMKKLKGEMSKGAEEGLKKVVVASNSAEGLKKGLEKAEDIVEQKASMEDEMEDDSEDMMDEESEDMEEMKSMSAEELKAHIEHCMEMLKQKEME